MPKQAYFNLPEEKKDRIRTAVMSLFGSLPYEEVTTRLLVKEAGISMGSLYQYFDSKDELYIYFIDELYTRLRGEGTYYEVMVTQDEEYETERRFIDSMFNAPAAVLEQYYFSKETGTFKLIGEQYREQKRNGMMPQDIDEGLYQFLSGAESLAVILYTRSLGISDPIEHRRFWRDNEKTIRYYMSRRGNIDAVMEEIQMRKEAEERIRARRNQKEP